MQETRSVGSLMGVLRVSIGHIGKASGEVQNSMGIICCNISGIFLTSSHIRKYFFTMRLTEHWRRLPREILENCLDAVLGYQS